jgi:2'-5' RNA ligase
MPARLFVALDLPPAAASAVAAICTALPAARWSHPGQLHLTLRFMAAVPDDEVAALGDRLAAVRGPAFPLSLRGVGVFPGGRKPPRVLWAGVSPEAPVQGLKSAIDVALGPDEEAARGFHPHLTLARFRDPPGPALAQYLAAHEGFATLPWTADAFLLYRSTLGTGGAQHQVLRRYPLAAA